MASKSQKKKEAGEVAAPGIQPNELAGFFEIRLVKSPKGPKRRLVRIGNASLRFNAGQEDETMVDFPAKKLHLTNAELAQLKADSDYVIAKAKVEKPKLNSLGFEMGRRTIDEGKTVKIGETTAPETKTEG